MKVASETQTKDDGGESPKEGISALETKEKEPTATQEENKPAEEKDNGPRVVGTVPEETAAV